MGFVRAKFFGANQTAVGVEADSPSLRQLWKIFAFSMNWILGTCVRSAI